MSERHVRIEIVTYIREFGHIMAGQILDNSQLESAVEEFAKDRQKDKYARVMEILEKSVVLVPVMKPQGLDEEAQRMMKAGKPVQLPKDAKIFPCLLRKDTGEQALPIFTSAVQIPQDKKSPGLAAMPFQACLSMVMANQDHIENMALNPFTHNIALPKTVLEVAVNRRKVMQDPRTVQVTEKQFAQIVHNRVAFYLLPKYLFEHKEEGLVRLQREEGTFLLQFYKDSYPEERKASITDSPEDFSVMALNITEDMQVTRVDMPDRTNKKGMCYRVYTVWMRGAQKILYYTLEKTDQGNYIGRVTPDGKHELVEPAPDNGAEIETVMNLAVHPEREG